MRRDRVSVFSTLFFASLAGALAFGSGIIHPVRADSLPTDALASVQFKPPGDPVPATSVGGGTRGNVRFAPPGEAAPTTSVGGGTRGNVRFAPPGEAAPSTSVAGGTRSEGANEVSGESAALQTLTALLPPNQYGRTVSPRPTFFVYVPPTTTRQVFFSLQDSEGNHHYQTTFEISEGGTVVSFTLPEDAPELEIGKDYLWFFVPLDASGTLQPDSYSVTGWVKRVDAIATASDVNAIALASTYAEAGVWYDTLTTLATAQIEQPENLTLVGEWQDLLEQVGLAAIADRPLAEQL